MFKNLGTPDFLPTNCTPKQAELILKAYKDKGVYLLEPDAASKPAVVEMIAADTFAPCPSSDDEN